MMVCRTLLLCVGILMCLQMVFSMAQVANLCLDMEQPDSLIFQLNPADTSSGQTPKTSRLMNCTLWKSVTFELDSAANPAEFLRNHTVEIINCRLRQELIFSDTLAFGKGGGVTITNLTMVSTMSFRPKVQLSSIFQNAKFLVDGMSLFDNGVASAYCSMQIDTSCAGACELSIKNVAIHTQNVMERNPIELMNVRLVGSQARLIFDSVSVRFGVVGNSLFNIRKLSLSDGAQFVVQNSDFEFPIVTNAGSIPVVAISEALSMTYGSVLAFDNLTVIGGGAAIQLSTSSATNVSGSTIIFVGCTFRSYKGVVLTAPNTLAGGSFMNVTQNRFESTHPTFSEVLFSLITAGGTLSFDESNHIIGGRVYVEEKSATFKTLLHIYRHAGDAQGVTGVDFTSVESENASIVVIPNRAEAAATDSVTVVKRLQLSLGSASNARIRMENFRIDTALFPKIVWKTLTNSSLQMRLFNDDVTSAGNTFQLGQATDSTSSMTVRSEIVIDNCTFAKLSLPAVSLSAISQTSNISVRNSFLSGGLLVDQLMNNSNLEVVSCKLRATSSSPAFHLNPANHTELLSVTSFVRVQSCRIHAYASSDIILDKHPINNGSVHAFVDNVFEYETVGGSGIVVRKDEKGGVRRGGVLIISNNSIVTYAAYEYALQATSHGGIFVIDALNRFGRGAVLLQTVIAAGGPDRISDNVFISKHIIKRFYRHEGEASFDFLPPAPSEWSSMGDFNALVSVSGHHIHLNGCEIALNSLTLNMDRNVAMYGALIVLSNFRPVDLKLDVGSLQSSSIYLYALEALQIATTIAWGRSFTSSSFVMKEAKFDQLTVGTVDSLNMSDMSVWSFQKVNFSTLKFFEEGPILSVVEGGSKLEFSECTGKQITISKSYFLTASRLVVENCAITQGAAMDVSAVVQDGSFVLIEGNQLVSSSGYGLSFTSNSKIASGSRVDVVGNTLQGQNGALYVDQPLDADTFLNVSNNVLVTINAWSFLFYAKSSGGVIWFDDQNKGPVAGGKVSVSYATNIELLKDSPFPRFHLFHMNNFSNVNEFSVIQKVDTTIDGICIRLTNSKFSPSDSVAMKITMGIATNFTLRMTNVSVVNPYSSVVFEVSCAVCEGASVLIAQNTFSNIGFTTRITERNWASVFVKQSSLVFANNQGVASVSISTNLQSASVVSIIDNAVESFVELAGVSISVEGKSQVLIARNSAKSLSFKDMLLLNSFILVSHNTWIQTVSNQPFSWASSAKAIDSYVLLESNVVQCVSYGKALRVEGGTNFSRSTLRLRNNAFASSGAATEAVSIVLAEGRVVFEETNRISVGTVDIRVAGVAHSSSANRNVFANSSFDTEAPSIIPTNSPRRARGHVIRLVGSVMESVKIEFTTATLDSSVYVENCTISSSLTMLSSDFGENSNFTMRSNALAYSIVTVTTSCSSKAPCFFQMYNNSYRTKEGVASTSSIIGLESSRLSLATLLEIVNNTFDLQGIYTTPAAILLEQTALNADASVSIMHNRVIKSSMSLSISSNPSIFECIGNHVDKSFKIEILFLLSTFALTNLIFVGNRAGSFSFGESAVPPNLDAGNRYAACNYAVESASDATIPPTAAVRNVECTVEELAMNQFFRCFGGLWGAEEGKATGIETVWLPNGSNVVPSCYRRLHVTSILVTPSDSTSTDALMNFSALVSPFLDGYVPALPPPFSDPSSLLYTLPDDIDARLLGIVTRDDDEDARKGRHTVAWVEWGFRNVKFGSNGPFTSPWLISDAWWESVRNFGRVSASSTTTALPQSETLSSWIDLWSDRYGDKSSNGTRCGGFLLPLPADERKIPSSTPFLSRSASNLILSASNRFSSSRSAYGSVSLSLTTSIAKAATQTLASATISGAQRLFSPTVQREIAVTETPPLQSISAPFLRTTTQSAPQHEYHTHSILLSEPSPRSASAALARTNTLGWTRTLLAASPRLIPIPAEPTQQAPLTAVEESSKKMADAIGVAVSATSIASVTGGQLGVANAMARLASCKEDDAGSNDEGVPILVHPLQFSFFGSGSDVSGDGNVTANGEGSLGRRQLGAYMAASVSNTLFIPAFVAVCARWPLPYIIRKIHRDSLSEAESLATVGWPFVIAMPFVTLAEGIGVGLTKSLLSNTAVGIVVGCLGLVATALFTGAWIRALVFVVPRSKLVLVENSDLEPPPNTSDKVDGAEDEDGESLVHFEGDEGGAGVGLDTIETPIHVAGGARRGNDRFTIPGLYRLFICSMTATKLWSPATLEGQEEEEEDNDERRERLHGSFCSLASFFDRHQIVTDEVLERYGNVIGDKRLFYAEFTSFICSIIVGVMEGVPSEHCRPRAVVALIATLLQCFCSCTTLVPLEFILQVALTLCVVPMSITVLLEVFSDNSNEGGGGGGEGFFLEVVASLIMVANAIGMILLVLALIMGIHELLTRRGGGGNVRHRRSSARRLSSPPQSAPLLADLAADEGTLTAFEQTLLLRGGSGADADDVRFEVVDSDDGDDETLQTEMLRPHPPPPRLKNAAPISPTRLLITSNPPDDVEAIHSPHHCRRSASTESLIGLISQLPQDTEGLLPLSSLSSPAARRGGAGALHSPTSHVETAAAKGAAAPTPPTLSSAVSSSSYYVSGRHYGVQDWHNRLLDEVDEIINNK